MPKRDNPRTGPKYEKPERPAAKRRTPAKGAAPAAKGRPAAQGRTPVRAEENPNLLIGRNPISEAIKAGRPIDKILMQKDAEGSARVIAGLARDNGIPVQYVDKLVLDKLAPGKSHQGIAAYAAAHKYVGVEDIWRRQRPGERILWWWCWTSLRIRTTWEQYCARRMPRALTG